jgi:hypothetical protein
MALLYHIKHMRIFYNGNNLYYEEKFMGNHEEIDDAFPLARLIFVTISLFWISSSAVASTSNPATITQLQPSTTAFTFATSSARSNPPSCAASYPNYWVIDDSTPHGQSMVAAITTAFATGKQVSVTGTGNCPTFQSAVEQVLWLSVSQ